MKSSPDHPMPWRTLRWAAGAFAFLALATVMRPVDNLTLSSTTISSGQTTSQQANLTITAGTSYTVQSGGTATFTAGTQITLSPGFTADSGSAFHAQIDYNQNGTSDLSEELTAVGTPYWTSFESAEGFSLANVNAQSSWYGGPDSLPVISTAAYDGTQSVSVPARNPTNSLIRYLAASSSSVMFVDFACKPAVSSTVDVSTMIDVGACRIGFVASGGSGQLQVFDGNGSGGGSWMAVGPTFALASGQATAWMRVTLRADFAHHTWDIYLNGQMLDHDLGFVSNGYNALPYFFLFGGTSAATGFDFPYAGSINPLFRDNDQDGMDDAWELANGLNPADPSDRTGNLDGDSYTNIEEFIQGTPANSSASVSFELFTPTP